jgi:hypothetical protein
MSLTYKGTIKDFKKYIEATMLVFGNITVQEAIKKLRAWIIGGGFRNGKTIFVDLYKQHNAER